MRVHQPFRVVQWPLVTGLVLLLGGCGGGGGGSTDGPPLQGSGKGELQAVSQPGELVDKVKALLVERQTLNFTAVPLAAEITGVPANPAPAFSSTTRQEDAVDEDDLIKTDGQFIYSYKTVGVSGGMGLPTTQGAGQIQLQVDRRAADGSLAAAQTLSLAKVSDIEAVQGMLLSVAAKRLASMRRSYTVDAGSSCPVGAVCTTIAGAATQATTLDLMDVGSDGTLQPPTQVQIQGELVASRMVGTTLVMVTTHRPLLAAERLETQAQRDAALATLTAADFLPNLRVNGGAASLLVQETQCFVQPGNGSLALEITTITTVDLTTAGFAATSRCFLGGAEALYMAPSNLYVATARWPQATRDADGRWVYPTSAELSTDIHKFSVVGTAINYRATGSATGHLGWQRDRTAYRMSEHNGDLRVVTFTGSRGWGVLADANSNVLPSPATLSVLREDSVTQRLQTVATLPNSRHPAPIGLPGEQVYAVRFLGGRAYVVTYRQIDPLYVLDLSNPADPLQAGELKITGFSESLFPLPGGLLLGVGKDADEQGFIKGVKVALFDVGNAAQPALVQTQTFGMVGSATALDFSTHGISLFTVGNTTRVGLPMALRTSSDFSQPSNHALQRMEVDAQAKRMTVLAPLGASATNDGYGLLTTDRSLHIGEHVYFYSGGGVNGFAW